MTEVAPSVGRRVLGLVDRFTLQHEAEQARALAEPARGEVQRGSRLALQKLAAASVLRRAGARAEALKLVADATDLLLAAADAAAAMPAELDRDAVSQARARVDAALAADAFGLAHEEAERALRRAAAVLHAELLPHARTDKERRVAFAGRMLLLALCLTGAAFAVRRVVRPKLGAEASAVHGPRYDAEQAIDGDDNTEWLLPDARPGWLDVTLSRPRPVRALRVLNARNRPGPDRATVDYRVEVFSRGVLVRTVEGTFGPFEASPPYKAISLGVAAPVDRIRFNVNSWAGQGGGLAELRIE